MSRYKPAAAQDRFVRRNSLLRLELPVRALRGMRLDKGTGNTKTYRS